MKKGLFSSFQSKRHQIIIPYVHQQEIRITKLRDVLNDDDSPDGERELEPSNFVHLHQVYYLTG